MEFHFVTAPSELFGINYAFLKLRISGGKYDFCNNCGRRQRNKNESRQK